MNGHFDEKTTVNKVLGCKQHRLGFGVKRLGERTKYTNHAATRDELGNPLL